MISKRANVFYLEKAKVVQDGERVVYWTTDEPEFEKAFNIPDKNTSFVLLGLGTSITNAAVRKLAESNVIIGFCGSGGSPLFGALDLTFMIPQDEYRPTEYQQSWVRMWSIEEERIRVAKEFLRFRLALVQEIYREEEILLSIDQVERFQKGIDRASNETQLLAEEAIWAKQLYKGFARHHDLPFKREEGKKSRETVEDRINSFIDHGNYLAYGYAATTLHALGISFAMPVLHGKTRRGALVFDVADLAKDWLVLPVAFALGTRGAKDKEFRAAIIDRAFDKELLDKLITFLKNATNNYS